MTPAMFEALMKSDERSGRGAGAVRSVSMGEWMQAATSAKDVMPDGR